MILSSFYFGVYAGTEGHMMLENVSCQMCSDGFALCIDIVEYSMQYNGTTKDAMKSYTMTHNDSLLQLKNKYELP